MEFVPALAGVVLARASLLVLEELRCWQALHPSPDEEKLPDNDGRSIVTKSITYLSNNTSRMDYPKYRRLGLPVTSSMVESLIKEFDYRVKGSEKAWTRSGNGEWILQTRNAVLCDDADRLSDFITSRPGCAYYRQRRCQGCQRKQGDRPIKPIVRMLPQAIDELTIEVVTSRAGFVIMQMNACLQRRQAGWRRADKVSDLVRPRTG